MSFRRRRRRRVARGSAPSNSGQMLNLSLFLMLLAFFIVLNSLSTYEELKSEEIKRSLKITFTSQSTQPETSETPDPAEDKREGHAFDRIDDLFKAQIASFESEQNRMSGKMYIRLRADDFFNMIESTPDFNLAERPTRRDQYRNAFLTTLVSLMREADRGRPYRLEIIANLDQPPGDLYTGDTALFRSRMENLTETAMRFERQGLPAYLLNVGVKEGEPEYLDLLFERYRPLSNNAYQSGGAYE